MEPCPHCGAVWEVRPERGEDEGDMIHRVHKPNCPIYIAIQNGTYYEED